MRTEMTVSELARYFSDRKFFTNPDQEVRFVLSPEDIPLEKGTVLEMRGSTVPERGDAVVAFRLAPVKKYRLSLRFEANPVIEARSLEEAEEKARNMMRSVSVMRRVAAGLYEEHPDYEAQEPWFLEEVKE